MACCDWRDIPQSRHFLSFPAIFHLLEAGVSKLLAASEATAKSAMSDMKIGLCSMDGPGGPLPWASRSGRHHTRLEGPRPATRGAGSLGISECRFFVSKQGPPKSSSIIQHHPASSSIIQHFNIDLMAHGWPIFFAVPLPFLDAAIHEKHR